MTKESILKLIEAKKTFNKIAEEENDGKVCATDDYIQLWTRNSNKGKLTIEEVAEMFDAELELSRRKEILRLQFQIDGFDILEVTSDMDDERFLKYA